MWFWAVSQWNGVGGDGWTPKASNTVDGGSALQCGHEGHKCFSCWDWYHFIKQLVWIVFLQQGIFSCSGQSVTQIKKEWSFRVARVRLWKKRKRSAIYMNLPHGVCASFIFFSFIIFLLVTWNLSTRWKKFA